MQEKKYILDGFEKKSLELAFNKNNVIFVDIKPNTYIHFNTNNKISPYGTVISGGYSESKGHYKKTCEDISLEITNFIDNQYEDSLFAEKEISES